MWRRRDRELTAGERRTIRLWAFLGILLTYWLPAVAGFNRGWSGMLGGWILVFTFYFIGRTDPRGFEDEGTPGSG